MSVDYELYLLKREPILDEFANFIYDTYLGENLFNILEGYYATSSFVCNVYDKFGRFKYEERWIDSFYPDDDIIDIFTDYNVPNSEEVFELMKEEYEKETTWVVKGGYRERLVYREIKVSDIPDDVKNAVISLIKGNCLKTNLEIVVCDGFSFGLRYVIRIDGETLSRISRCENIVKTASDLYEEKYWGLYEYYIFF